MDIYGYSYCRVRTLLREYGVFPVILGNKGSTQVYRKQDFAPLVERWNLKQFIQNLDNLWQRFFPPACGTCKNCQKSRRDPFIRQVLCGRESEISLLRSVFGHFLGEVYRKGSVTAWWNDYHMGSWTKRTSSAWGVIFIYLLDKRLIHLSNVELLQLEPIRGKGYPGMTRLWRNRRPEEYQQYLQAMKATNYKSGSSQDKALGVISLFVLLKYGLSGVAELGRPLSSNEILKVCSERRLITSHIGSGLFLPYPLTIDIRVGHVVLDDIRWYFWQYAANQVQKSTKESWYQGPCGWVTQTIRIIEQTLAAPMFEQAKGIISRRPETEKTLVNPLRIAYKGKLANTGYALLPRLVQEYLMAYIKYCHQERHLELYSLEVRAKDIIHFFTWVRKQEKLVNFPYWTREFSHEVFRTYASHACAEIKAISRQSRFKNLYNFFSTINELEYPVPSGYHLLYYMEKCNERYPREVPNEEVMDRVFRDGVCNLTYDVFSRLALTIQYYCGTRVTETIELHLFCILEDQRGHAFLLIPKGKSKQERPFPIVEPGMEYLNQYIDEIIKLRFSKDGTTSRTLGENKYALSG